MSEHLNTEENISYNIEVFKKGGAPADPARWTEVGRRVLKSESEAKQIAEKFAKTYRQVRIVRYVRTNIRTAIWHSTV